MTDRNAAKEQKTASGPDVEPKLGRRERNRQEKLARIVNAARTLFRAKGFQGTTVNDIADAADIGFGTLFLYARSKEELLVMVFKDEMLEVVEKTYAKMPNRPLAEQVLFLFEGFVAYHRRDVPLSRALMKEIFFLDNPVRRREVLRLMHSIYGRLGELIERAQAEGTFRTDANPILVARNLFAIYVHLLNSWLGGYMNYPRFTKLLPDAVKLQLTQLSSTPAPKRRVRGKTAG